MKESEIQREILRKLLEAGWLPIRFNSGAKTIHSQSSYGRYITFYQVAGTLTRGLPDIIAFKEGRHLFLEVKARHGKQNDAQKAFAALGNKFGETVHVVRSWSEVEHILAREICNV